jgi:hypothetical protein
VKREKDARASYGILKMKKLIAVLLLVAAPVFAGVKKPFPAHWGEPPRIQTMDMVTLPDGYGTGSSTLRNWIAAKLEADKKAATGGAATAQALPVVWRQDFEKLPADALPESGFLVLAGDFTVKEDAGAKFMELPGAPLDTFGVLTGPPLTGDAAVSARIFGTSKARRQPTFAVGLGGASPWKLVVAPGKSAVELWRDDQFKATAPWTWKSGAWTMLKLEVRKAKEGEWLISGKVWDGAGSEPAAWTVQFKTDEAPLAGRASVWGSPFSGTPIRFDDIVVSGTAGK